MTSGKPRESTFSDFSNGPCFLLIKYSNGGCPGFQPGSLLIYSATAFRTVSSLSVQLSVSLYPNNLHLSIINSKKQTEKLSAFIIYKPVGIIPSLPLSAGLLILNKFVQKICFLLSGRFTLSEVCGLSDMRCRGVATEASLIQVEDCCLQGVTK